MRGPSLRNLPCERSHGDARNAVNMFWRPEEATVTPLLGFATKIWTDANAGPTRSNDGNIRIVRKQFRARPWKETVTKARAADDGQGKQAHERARRRLRAADFAAAA